MAGVGLALYNLAYNFALRLIEAELVPDFIVRKGIRYLLSTRLAERPAGTEALSEHVSAFVADLKGRAIAEQTAAANEQHYEVPTEYYLKCLGKHLKYSCCWYDTPGTSLDDAEGAMLAKTCERAELADGQKVLELGCGWGSLSLFMAAAYPKAKVTAVSNSRTQKAFIDARAAERGIKNLTVVTCDINDFEAPEAGKYDRVVSVEMFEHMKNYEKLMGNVRRWLKPGGKLFVHIFVHRDFCYHFEPKTEDDWMSKHFFTGGTMPSDTLLFYFLGGLAIDAHWHVNGTHYGYTCRDWLRLMDGHRADVLPIIDQAYGRENRTVWWMRWRLFYMSCEELFNYDSGDGRGNTWFVSHYRFVKPVS